MAIDDSHQGSFLNGFTLGLFAGAAGYFLFGTTKGESVRDKVSHEWNQAKESLADQGVIESSNMSIRDFLYSLVEQLDKPDKPDKPQQKSGKSTKSHTSTKRRLFKNT